jgi:DNA-binding winged helix-turn-helix (wHTH) protein/tetratricopeptide (TPR) repeat protein
MRRCRLPAIAVQVAIGARRAKGYTVTRQRRGNTVTDTPIILANEPPFALGAVSVEPALRQITAVDGVAQILEPRVMQVLVALAQAKGGIVGRDTLTLRCWEGRIVGEDAINRVLSRLRQIANGAGAGIFRIETVTKVGYRLVLLDGNGSTVSPPAAGAASAPVGRRVLVGGAAVAAAALASGAFWYARRSREPAIPPEIAAMMTQGSTAMFLGTPDGVAQGVGIFEQVVQRVPDYADGWGWLALAYAFASHGAPASRGAMKLRANAAIRHTLALDPYNARAWEARVWLYPRRGAWLEAERVAREALRHHPDDYSLLLALAFVIAAAGRLREAADLSDHAAAVESQPTPALRWNRIQLLWAANRIEEADHAATEAAALYPRHSAVWFSRVYLFMYTGRIDEALAMLANVEGRPLGIPFEEFDKVSLVATALKTHAPADIDAALKPALEMAHKGSGYAENAIQYASALGRVDLAFTVADAYFFSRGFTVGSQRFSAMQGGFAVNEDRRTAPLFLPSTKAMRHDPRFAPLVKELGLADYWRAAGVTPDYLKGGDL